jgi:hypothetical protein
VRWHRSCDGVWEGPFPMRSGPRSCSPSVCRSKAAVCRPAPQGGIPRPTQQSPRPVRLCGGDRQIGLPQMCRWTGGAKNVQDKSGWSLSRPPAVHPAPQRGSGTGTRWSVWPPVDCGGWSEMKITEKKPPGFSLSQGGCAGWFLRKREEFDYEKKTSSFSRTGWPR